MRKKLNLISLITAFALLVIIMAGCQSSKKETPNETVEIHNPATVPPLNVLEGEFDISLEMVPLTEMPAMFSVSMPVASGTTVKQNAKALIDMSNVKDGYVMIKYMENTTKALRVQIKGQSGAVYTYTLKGDGSYEVYPLSDGNGSYQINVFENIEGSRYSVANSATVDVTLTDEFAPFLRPNQYVNYTADSNTVKKAVELTAGATTVIDKINAVYTFVINNFTYDRELAATVQSGYLPNVDNVLAKGKGICFDYAAVMTAMLRSQNIPAKLVVGYTGEVYHAWINVYSSEAGKWLDSVIQFDGKTWKLMDPTFDSTGGQSAAVREYIGDGANYTAKYLY